MNLTVSQEALPLAFIEEARKPNGWIAVAYYAQGGYWKTAGGFHRSLNDAQDALAQLGFAWTHRQIYKIGEPIS